MPSFFLAFLAGSHTQCPPAMLTDPGLSVELYLWRTTYQETLTLTTDVLPSAKNGSMVLSLSMVSILGAIILLDHRRLSTSQDLFFRRETMRYMGLVEGGNVKSLIDQGFSTFFICVPPAYH